jgi:CheY-like chemotaxis protein
LIEQCRQHGPDLVIADCKLPDMDVMDAAEEVCSSGRLPFIFTAVKFDPQQILRNGADHGWAYLMKPINIQLLECIRLPSRTQKKSRANRYWSRKIVFITGIRLVRCGRTFYT